MFAKFKLACKTTDDESSSSSTTPRVDPFQIRQLEENLEIVLKAKNQYYDEVRANRRTGRVKPFLTFMRI